LDKSTSSAVISEDDQNNNFLFGIFQRGPQHNEKQKEKEGNYLPRNNLSRPRPVNVSDLTVVFWSFK